MENKIVVIDFGSQYNHLITRRIRNLGVYSDLISHKTSIETIQNDKSIIGIILSGGPNSVYEKGAPKIDHKIFALGLPVLGICYGAQLIAHSLKGKVSPCNLKEYGNTKIKVLSSCPLTTNLSKSEIVWMSHGDQVSLVPKDFKTYASSSTCPHVMFGNVEKNIYGIQFHAEVVHTTKGNQILSNFIKLCNPKTKYNMSCFINKEVNEIKKIVGKDNVLCALSGGVDSVVTASLIYKAIGKQLTCVFVDHGLLRQNEAQLVKKIFKTKFGSNFVAIDAQDRFLSKLKRVTSPEKKRKIIGKAFIDIFSKFASNKDKKYTWLAQGTLYTDIIESGTDTAHTIKSHHNVGGLPKRLKFKLIEPLKSLYKDEVRELGKKLGLPHDMVMRQPFPGPGLGIRIVGEITKEKLRLVKETDLILRDEIKKNKLDSSIWQYFTVLPGIKTVGVKGDQRSYEDVIVLRAITSVDGMTADYAQIPYDVMTKIANRITNEVKGINRVCYDVTSKPPSTIEWE